MFSQGQYVNLNSKIDVSICDFQTSTQIAEDWSNIHRWYILILVCMLSFGHYFFLYALPSMETVLMKEFEVSNQVFGMIVAAGHIPHLFCPFVGGVLFDNFEMTKLVIAVLILVLIGEIILINGLYGKIVWMSVFGNFVFGIGSIILVLSRAMIGKYFVGSVLGLSLGLNEAMSIAAKFLATMTVGIVAYNCGASVGLWYSVGISSISLGASVLYYALRKQMQVILVSFSANSDHKPLNNQEITCTWHFFATFLRLPRFYWLLVFVSALFHGVFFCLSTFIVEFLQHKWQLTVADAAVRSSVQHLVGALICPIGGYIADLIGYPLWICFFCGILGSGSLWLLNSTMLNPLIGITGIAITSSFLPVVIYSMISMNVCQSNLGVAFGCHEVLSGLSKVLGTVIIGAFLSKKSNFPLCLNALIVVLLVGTTLILSLSLLDTFCSSRPLKIPTHNNQFQEHQRIGRSGELLKSGNVSLSFSAAA